MMSSICLAMTAVSFGVAASARRLQPANGAAVAPASNRRLVISVMVSFPFGSRSAAVCRIQAVYRDNRGSHASPSYGGGAPEGGGGKSTRAIYRRLDRSAKRGVEPAPSEVEGALGRDDG